MMPNGISVIQSSRSEADRYSLVTLGKYNVLMKYLAKKS